MREWDGRPDGASRESWDEYVRNGIAHLRRDPVLADLVDGTEPPTQRSSHDLFTDLADAIVSQQLSVKAAASIMGRFTDLFTDGRPVPAEVARMDDATLRGAGLSRGKVRYLRSIAEAVLDGTIDLETIARYDDEAFITALTTLPGVGRWTAEMMLIFSLGRGDVFSVGDLGLRKAVARLYDLDRDDREAINAVALRWRPYRSLACHYLWKSLDNAPMSRDG